MALNQEPTVWIGGLAEIFRAIIPMLLIFGIVHWTDQQTGTIVLFIGVLVSFAEKLFIRSQVVTTAVADKQIEVAKASDITRSNDSIIAQAAKESK